MLQSAQEALEEVWPPAGWITKKEAAARLKLSEPRVAAMAGDSTLQSMKSRNPSTNQVVTLINAVDVERVGFEREHPDEVTRALATKPTKPDKPPQAALPAPETEAPSSSSRREFLESIEAQPWLTLDEAAAFSGLTKRWLLALAKAKWPIPITETGTSTVAGIAIRDMGKHAPGGRWRFHRESLEKA